ncbi:MAG TPA: hypothetical protein VME63_07560 [Dyella sp.]|uniref:hypothetical protein n=1 Tax=Dyella sp. TaxID=1869338 RepID=UPI002BA94717|nr:hypothetical protein [Dyella sp.]HTV85245.1 hypothetical protein [Dyella sp.]
MKRTLCTLALGAAGSIAAIALCPPVFAQTASTDSYASMLSYLDSNSIGDNALSGTQGISSVNTASGDANAQANLHAFASGSQSQTLIQARQRTHYNTTDVPLDATATIGGHAYDNGQGIASINQVSGNGNAQLNGVSVALTAQGIRETTDGTLSATVSASAGGQAPSNPQHAQAGGTRSVGVDPSAMEGFNGVMQLNQVAGSGNASDNLLLLSAPASSH